MRSQRVAHRSLTGREKVAKRSPKGRAPRVAQISFGDRPEGDQLATSDLQDRAMVSETSGKRPTNVRETSGPGRHPRLGRRASDKRPTNVRETSERRPRNVRAACHDSRMAPGRRKPTSHLARNLVRTSHKPRTPVRRPNLAPRTLKCEEMGEEFARLVGQPRRMRTNAAPTEPSHPSLFLPQSSLADFRRAPTSQDGSEEGRGRKTEGRRSSIATERHRNHPGTDGRTREPACSGRRE